MNQTDSEHRHTDPGVGPLDDGPARWRQLGAGALVFLVTALTLYAMALGARSAIREHVTLSPGAQHAITIPFLHPPALPREATGARVQPVAADSGGSLRVRLVRAEAGRDDTLLTWLAAYGGSRTGIRIAVRETGIEDGIGYARLGLSADPTAPPRTYRLALRAWYTGYTVLGPGDYYEETVTCPGCVAPADAPQLLVTVRTP